jgi:NRPS condensation-like uncharacterized protein
VSKLFSEDVLFFPPKGSYSKKIEGWDSTLVKLTTKVTFVFSGEINHNKFIEATKVALKDFHWFFCTVKNRNGDLYAEYNSSGSEDIDKDDYVRLEIRFDRDRNFSINDDPELCLPKKINEKERNIFISSINPEGLSFFRLSLKIFKNHSVIGISINHCCLDFSTILYYLQYVSDIYSNGFTDLKKPVFVDRKEIMGDMKINSLDDLGSIRPEFVSDNPMIPDSLLSKDIFLNFDSQNISALKLESDDEVSTNDIINAVLLKAVSRLSRNKSTEVDIQLFNMINMRKYFSLGSEVMGDYIYHKPVCIKKERVDSSSMLELSSLAHQAIKGASKEDYQLFLQWFFQNERLTHKSPGFTVAYNSAVGQLSNCSNFDCTKINFQGVAFSGIVHGQYHRLAGMYGFVSSLMEVGEKQISLYVSTHYRDYIRILKDLGSETGLFSVTQLPQRKNSSAVKTLGALIQYLSLKAYSLLKNYFFHKK